MNHLASNACTRTLQNNCVMAMHFYCYNNWQKIEPWLDVETSISGKSWEAWFLLAGWHVRRERNGLQLRHGKWCDHTGCRQSALCWFGLHNLMNVSTKKNVPIERVYQLPFTTQSEFRARRPRFWPLVLLETWKHELNEHFGLNFANRPSLQFNIWCSQTCKHLEFHGKPGFDVGAIGLFS